jgi:hypothetical protein
MTAPASSPAPTAGVARAHRAVALLFLLSGVVQFFLAGLGAFGDGWSAHRTFGTVMTVLALILLILAIVGRRDALQPSIVLFVLTVVQGFLATIGRDTAVVGALHPVNALLILWAASMAMAARRFTFPPPRPA